MKQILHTAAGEVMMDYIVTLRWFMRVWVVQEFILAKELTFIVGDYVVSDVAMFHALAKTLQTGRKRWLQKYLGSSVSVADYTANHLVHLHSIRMMFEIRFAKRGRGGPNHLLSCVLLGWNRRAKITKDKVSDVLGLMDPIGSQSPVANGRPSRSSFNFDYIEDDRTTFVDYARPTIEEEQSLVGLSLSRGVARQLRLLQSPWPIQVKCGFTGILVGRNYNVVWRIFQPGLSTLRVHYSQDHWSSRIITHSIPVEKCNESRNLSRMVLYCVWKASFGMRLSS